MTDGHGNSTRRCPVVDFDHHRPATEMTAEEATKALRAQCPVGWSEHHGGFWIISGYPEVAQALKSHRSFSSSREHLTQDGVAVMIPAAPLPPFIPQEMDPPEHLKYRRLVSVALSAAESAKLAPRVAHWTTHYLDRFIERGSCDLIYDLAIPVPAAVTLEWIGIAPEHWRAMSEAFHDLSGYPADSERGREAYAGLQRMHEHVAEELAARRADPREDFLSFLARAEVDGALIPIDTLRSIVVLVIGGGVDTTTSLVASALLHFQRHPGDRERLLADPSLWDSATQEFLRRYPPFFYIARTAVDDIELGGAEIRAGDRVLVAQGSACHDEQMFAEPHEFVIDRSPNVHVAFGLGSHRCPGMHLAKIEFREMVRQVLERMPDYRIDEAAVASYPSQSSIVGTVAMPATFTPGPRRDNLDQKTVYSSAPGG
jgi:cytochrome P450